VAAIKLNYPLVLATGVEIAHRIKQKVPDVPLIADFKVADIDNTNTWIARHAFSAGFDAIIVHAFVGQDAIQAVLDEAQNYGGRGVILVVDMSHPGALQFINPQAHKLAKLAVELDVTGVIAPGTRPDHVSQIRRWIGPKPLILTPGVGAQGGKPGSAIAAGADYEIIGRSIYQAKSPAEAARKFAAATFDAKAQQTQDKEGVGFVGEIAQILYETEAIKFGSFTLGSGVVSPFYIDHRLIPSYPAPFARLIDLQLQWLTARPDIQFDRIAGIPTAGLSFGTMLSQGLNKPLIYVRKEAKRYGRKQLVEGKFEPGDRVLVVDDLITDGGSKLVTAKILRDVGLKVKDIFVVVDREQGGEAKLAEVDLQLRALVKITDLVDTLLKKGYITTQQAQEIRDYLNQ
jgi:uridine monophosphate synthetase